MSICQSLLPEFDVEMANTRKALERIPESKLDWKAHPKSNTIGWVGMHLAEIPGWTDTALSKDSFDIAPPGEVPYTTPKATSVKQILEIFDKNVQSSRAALSVAKDDDVFKPWSLLDGGKVMLTMPRIAVVRTFVLNHSIHHRGHLCVYLRLNDVPVPGMYGPSGDE